MASITDIGFVTTTETRARRTNLGARLRLLRRLWYRRRLVVLASRELANPRLLAEVRAIEEHRDW